MIKPLDGFVFFSTEPYGYNMDQVGQYIMELHQKYEKLRKDNIRLKRRVNIIKENCKPDKQQIKTNE